MLRLGQFTDTFLPIVDGVGRVVYAYADTLCKMGHQVTVVAPMYDTGFQGGFPFELVDFMGAGLPGMKQYQIGEAVWDPHYRRRMRMIELDLIHAHSPFTAGSEALRIATLRKLPLVATFHSKYYDDFLKATKSESIARMGTKFVVNFYNRCDEVWAVGKNAADVLKDYGYEGDVIVMPNGATMRTVSPADVEGVSRRWNLGNDPVILFVGQMDWKKNILTILEACAEMKKAGTNFRLPGPFPDARPYFGYVPARRAVRPGFPLCLPLPVRHHLHGGARGRRHGHAVGHGPREHRGGIHPGRGKRLPLRERPGRPGPRDDLRPFAAGAAREGRRKGTGNHSRALG